MKWVRHFRPTGSGSRTASDESGRDEIFVRPFPDTAGGRWQVSTAGGTAARWAHIWPRALLRGPVRRHDGDAPVTPGSTFTPGRAAAGLPAGIGADGSNVVPLYDLTPDDQRPLMARLSAANQAAGVGQLVVVENWIEELKAEDGEEVTPSDASVRLASDLRDRYRLDHELGQGGMATVYLAEDLKHRRKVAIEVLHPELASLLGPDRSFARSRRQRASPIPASCRSSTLEGTGA